MSENENLSLEVFDSPEFGQMRILREGDKYLFCANDAAVALGYSNPRAALQRHCKGVAKRDTLTPGGVQSLPYIPEGDLYRLIIHSKLPSAEKFEHWVFEEVLPCIRKTGGYMTDNLLNELMNEPDIIYKVTSDMLKERGQRMRLEGEVKAAKPKVEYFDSFITAEDCTNIRTTAKEIQVPEKQFIAWMLKNKYLYRTAKEAAGIALLDAVKKAIGLEPVSIGTYRGFHITAILENFGKDRILTLSSALSHQVTLGNDARGNLIRIDNALRELPQQLTTSKNQLENLQSQMEFTKAELGKPFPQEAELAQKSQRLAELNALLDMDGKQTTEQAESKAAPDERPSVLEDLHRRSASIPPHKHSDSRSLEERT